MTAPKPRKSRSGTRWTDAERLERTGVVRVTVPLPVTLVERIEVEGPKARVIRETLERAFPDHTQKK